MLARSAPASLLQWLESFSKVEIDGQLHWFDAGVGWLPPETSQIEYGQKYFDEFKLKAKTELGKAIMRSRVELVARHYRGLLCDVGIGCGAFIEARNAMTCGWDINPFAIAWLKSRKLLIDPSVAYFPSISMWDVLEHIPDFSGLLNNTLHWVFLTVPIFTDRAHALASKHFKPGEHCWYFTRAGLHLTMKHFHFECMEGNRAESDLGREDIESFAFRRVAD